MKRFHCDQCGQQVYFENSQCKRCGALLGFLSGEQVMVALKPRQNNVFELVTPRQHQRQWKFCRNANEGVCNWLLPAEQKSSLCQACELNRHIPNLDRFAQKQAWQRLEMAKHRVIYSLLRLQLPLTPKCEDPKEGLAFDFISEADPIPAQASTITGHQRGQVTINAEEANHAIREQRREQMDESYRTLIGHLRHEVGHYYWEQLVQKKEHLLQEFRQLFGSESLDYKTALTTYYQQGAAKDWRQRCISAYASSHPWEDWAETWAHYFHIMETVETGFAFQMAVREPKEEDQKSRVELDIDPYLAPDFAEIFRRFLPLSVAINTMNRGMGQPDLYPFVANELVLEKLQFIHRVLAEYRKSLQ